jgi:ABC-type Fe3+-hydroxamate transport system substrate-binding protein
METNIAMYTRTITIRPEEGEDLIEFSKKVVKEVAERIPDEKGYCVYSVIITLQAIETDVKGGNER